MQVEGVPEVVDGVLVLAARLEDLAKSEVLQPGVLVGRLGVERAVGEFESVVEVLQVEENPRQVEQYVRVVWTQGQRFAEAFHRLLCVAFDAPEVADLVVDLWRLRLLQKFRSQSKQPEYFNKINV